MHRTITIIVVCLLWTVIPTTAQLIVDGRVALWDEQTNTLLATVPDTCFHQTVKLNIQIGKEWKACTILGMMGGNSITITKLTAEKRIAVNFEDSTGTTHKATLQFTFLPLVQLKGNFGYDYQDGTVLLSDPSQTATDTLTATIKWRGGMTNGPDKHKRNYKVKLEADTTLLGMRNDNSWILDAGQPDVFRLRNPMAMDLWNDMASKPYYADQEPKARNGVSGKVVEVFLNNEYLGIYNFSENIDRKQMKLKKVKDGQVRGCLYKGKSWDGTQMYDTLFTFDNRCETLRGFEVKYPDLADNDTTDWAPLVEANNFVRMSSDEEFAQHVEEYFDLTPMVDYSVFLSVVNGVDNSGKNMFWAVYDKTADRKLTLAPWDLDATFGQRWGGLLVGGDNDHSVPEYKTDVDVRVFLRLYSNNVCHFNDALWQRYQQLRQPGQPLSTDSLISRLNVFYHLVKDSGAARRETKRWSGDSDIWGDTIDFDAEYEYIRRWITDHLALIDLCGLPIYYTKDFFDTLAVPSPTVTPHSSFLTPHSSFLISLSGQRVNDSRHVKPGIYIKNGKKIIVR